MNKSKQTKRLKRILTMAGLVLITAASSQVYAQNGVGINPTGAAAHPSAVLDASSTTQGFLPPRMTATQRDAILNPATGLVVFCTDCGPVNVGGELQVYSGGTWRNMTGGAVAIPPVGQSYGGGIIAYILQPSDPGYDANVPHGLIAATSDQGTAEWGCFGISIAGADGSAIGTGNQNTIDIMNNDCSTEVIAARICGDLVLNGYSDWYLPSKDELNILYQNIGQGAPFPNTNVGGFADYFYWSSTEYNNNFAWLQYFTLGGVLDNVKNDTSGNVRSVRAF
jgi:hypothetical protein